MENEVNDESQILNEYLKRNETCALICNHKQCVHFSQLNDGHVDCNGPEGPLDETVGKLETSNSCYNILGHIIWSPRCVYIKDMYKAVLGCRDMSQLRNCTDCMCPEGYFNIFPEGDEEYNYIIDSCSGNFACCKSTMCLHPDLVCDGHPECPYQDDEVECSLSCAKGFLYVSGTITVSDYKKSIPLPNFSFIDGRQRYLVLSGVDLSLCKLIDPSKLMNTLFIDCSHCNISNLPSVLHRETNSVRRLDLEYDEIVNIKDYNTFVQVLRNLRHFNLSYNKQLDVKYLLLKNLEVLDLSHTGLSYLDKHFLIGLPNLKHFNLSFTLISALNKYAFSSQFKLQTIDLRGIQMKNFHEDLFYGLIVNQDLYTDSFEMCCPKIRGENIPYYICHAPEDAFSSCYDLVRINVQRVLLWVVAVLAVLGNVTVIVYRVVWDRSVLRTGYGLFVTNLGISDFIMGVYLFIIAGADYYYRGVYVLYDKNWRESIVCKLASFFSILSRETSAYFIFLITLDRFLVMKFPFRHVEFSRKNKIIFVILSWLIGLLLALIPFLFNFDIFTSNAMCLSLPLTVQRLYGWEYSFSVFIVHNLFIVLVIGYGQRAIFKAMSMNRISQTSSTTFSRRSGDILVAKQLLSVALSNGLCCFPVGVMGLLSLSKIEINSDVFAWTTVVILPINSAANPILYTIPAAMSRWDKFKQEHFRSD